MGSGEHAVRKFPGEENLSLVELIEVREKELRALQEAAREPVWFERGTPADTRPPFTLLKLLAICLAVGVMAPIGYGLGCLLYRIGLFGCCAAMLFLGILGRK